MDVSLIESIEKKLTGQKPGMEAQALMSPVDTRMYAKPDYSTSIACVMLLLFPSQGQWNVIYIKRSDNNPNDRHAGQVSFPGGKMEEIDESYEACALRETYEEIGIPQDKIGIIGTLSSLYVHVSNFMVYPYVGFVTSDLDLQLQASEVKDVIIMPLDELRDKEIIKKGPVQLYNGSTLDVPYYDLAGNKLWGATAMITSEFLNIIADL